MSKPREVWSWHSLLKQLPKGKTTCILRGQRTSLFLKQLLINTDTVTFNQALFLS